MGAQSNIEPSIIAALAKALPELESAKKNKPNPAFKSKYADIAAVIEAIQPVVKYGLWYRQFSHERQDGACVETFYIHESGQELSAGTVFMPATKKDAQGFGSAETYARRYGLQLAFGLATEDDDGNRAARPQVDQERPTAISDDQLAQLEQMIPAAKLTPAQFNQTFGIAKVKDLPAARFDEALNRLNTRMAELAKADTNKEAVNA